MSSAIDDVKNAIRAKHAAEEALAAAVKIAWPIGSEVRYTRHKGGCVGRVLDHGSAGGRVGEIKVQNIYTHAKPYWVSWYDILGPIEP